ncbi:MAG: hypothetical protein C5B54_02480 [Acidobacteria bacterium]|nr:MAG: hypothetical protein C5B54_02480 [Acidobacteriota bacterium]
MDRHFRVSILIVTIIFLVSGLGLALADDKDDVQKKQAAILKMRDETLAALYKDKPEAKAKVEKAAGYAVFDQTGIHLLLLATERGHGLAVNNATNKPVYMKMTTVGAGPGLGVKDYQVIFIFAKAAALNKFIEAGWSGTAGADASAKTKKEGGATGGTANTSEGTEIYTITKKGVALQATLGGTKFSKDDDLN